MTKRDRGINKDPAPIDEQPSLAGTGEQVVVCEKKDGDGTESAFDPEKMKTFNEKYKGWKLI